MRLLGSKGGEDQRSYHPVATHPHHEFELWMTAYAEVALPVDVSI